MTLSVPRVRHYLQNFELSRLFVEELGWDRHAATIPVLVDGQNFTLRALAEKRGVQILECMPDSQGRIPAYEVRRKIEKQVTRAAIEHLIIFVDAAKTAQIWQWVARQPGQPAAFREHPYSARAQSGDALIQKLSAITIPLSEEEAIDLLGTVHKLRDAFDRDRVTKRFYDHFQREHAAFLEFIQGITDQGDREWYASLMLNRLMFVYFIQKKGFLDRNDHYLQDRLAKVQARKGKGKFQSFYRYFLLCLFHEGFAKQPATRSLSQDLTDLLGEVPYLNGGLFDLHELEARHDQIDIPDEAFERLFAFFDQYEWHLDTRPLRDGREINPDVLGYIFEKYINQKQMGAYYTKEDITDYISKNTILPHLFDTARKKCAIAFEPGSALWRQLKDNPDRYLYPAVRQGVIDDQGAVIPLPAHIQKGIADVGQRDGWNRPALAPFNLPTESWREHVSRRQRCLDLRGKLAAGEICQINDFITYNLDIRQFAADTIASCEGPELLRAFYQALSTVTVLDPTCGSGAFLFAALNILQPLYEACLDRMQAFVDDLDRSGVAHSPKKFEDFRRILADVARHSNRDYFILKSIIVRNLYGVDIMEEAVEICKLRLFLKLVAQVERVKDLEPLPDIDFNIRPGNTLVGFATLEDVKKTLAGTLGFGQDQVARIVEEAEIVDRAFTKFHEMQTALGMDGRAFAEDKQELRKRLDTLSEKLDGYLAGEYGVDPEKKQEFAEWVDSHKPFHWFAEFYGIMSRSGFDVIIGNPPYVEYHTIKDLYQLKGFQTERCANLYAYVLERCFSLSRINARIGMIVQLSAICTDRMQPLQNLYRSAASLVFASCFDDRPGKLFDGLEHIRATIILSTTASSKNAEILTTNLMRWPTEARSTLFTRLQYGSVTSMSMSGSFPKASDPQLVCLLNRIWSQPNRLERVYNARSPNLVFYYRSPLYWIRAMDFLPHFSSEVAQRSVHHFKDYPVLDPSMAGLVGCLINSSVFYIWFVAYGNGRNVTLRDINTFPVPESLFTAKAASSFQKLFARLMSDYRKNSSIRRRRDGIEFQEFSPGKSKPIMDEIDLALAPHFKFTEDELDFIINYDIKYRMGQVGGQADE